MAGASGARRIELNRSAFDAITLAVADGAFELAKSVIEGADVPDAAPYGEGLVQGGAAIAYVGKKRIGVWSKTGSSVKKPRAARLSAGVTVIAGYGFPGRFKETGTVRMAATPFLAPELMAKLPDAEGFVKAAAIRHRIIAATRARVGDVTGAQGVTREARAEVARVRRALGG